MTRVTTDPTVTDPRSTTNPNPGREDPATVAPPGPRWWQWAWFFGLYLASLVALLVVVTLVKWVLPLPH